MYRRIIAVAFIFAGALACGPNEGVCNNGQCYDPTTTTCTQDAVNGNYMTCPTTAPNACNGACYNPNSYHCSNGGLAGGPASKSNVQSTTTSQAPASSTSSSTSSTSSTSSSVSPLIATTSSCSQDGCGSGLCSCNGQCFPPNQYNCAIDQFTGQNMLCPSNYNSCNKHCFDPSQYYCANGGLVYGAPAQKASTSSSSSTTSSSSATPTTAPAPVVNPSPSPNRFPTQTSDLRIINNCKSPLWIEGRYGGNGAPIPGHSTTSIRALPGSYVDYTVPDSGLGGSRFWAKYGCDDNGRNCLIGDAMQYWPNPPGGCPVGGCSPPVDSLFEATWGCRPGSSCNAQNPTTWFDTSQVDGWTIPYKLTPNGDTSGCDCTATGCGFGGVDASKLDLAKCPSGEDLSYQGRYPTVQVNGKTTSLSSVDLRIVQNSSVIGCMSPCKRLNWGTPYGLQQPESSGSGLWMCCPTPTPEDCQLSQGCVTPSACRAGPIVGTQYVAAVHSMAPGVYSYSYDDGVGLHACPAGVVTYTMEFCPSGSAQYPLPL